jgi:phosphoribosyl 1,2-cyclic phosphate phosphodiesterase
MSGTLRLTILGSGSSGGVPRVGGDWGACDPAEPKNRRTRGSLLAQKWQGAPGHPSEATTVLIDTSPDLREQLLAAQVGHLDAILYSHDHADQSHGIDDVRALALIARKRIPTYMDPVARATLTNRFAYCFTGASGGYPAILEDVGVIEHGETISIMGPGGALRATPLIQDHGTVMSFGFRFGPAAYSNDLVTLPAETKAALTGLDLWIVDALRYKPHPTHANLEQALAWIAELRPAQAVLTNMHQDLDYATLQRALPPGVEPGYDGWSLDFAV